MRMIADAIERGLLAANYKADLASKRRSLSAWGTVERKGAAWTWQWTGVGIPAKYLPEPMKCVSDDAAWLALEATVLVITRDVRRIGAGG
jgi:hypothetical protein